MTAHFNFLVQILQYKVAGSDQSSRHQISKYLKLIKKIKMYSIIHVCTPTRHDNYVSVSQIIMAMHYLFLFLFQLL